MVFTSPKKKYLFLLMVMSILFSVNDLIQPSNNPLVMVLLKMLTTIAIIYSTNVLTYFFLYSNSFHFPD